MARGGNGISRRGLLIGGGAAIGLVVAWQAWPRRYAPNLVADEGETLFNAFLKIGADGRVIVAVPQAELGQGSWTALPQILADELGADWRTVGVEPAPLSPLYVNQLFASELAQSALPTGLGGWAMREQAERSALMLTGGSSSVRAFEPRLREAGAGARALLQMAAAERWGGDWEDLDTQSGFVVQGDRRIAFAELAEAAAGLDLPEHLPVRGGLENRLTGQPLPRLDTPAKLDGTARFAADVRLPGMAFASIRTGPLGGRLVRYEREARSACPDCTRSSATATGSPPSRTTGGPRTARSNWPLLTSASRRALRAAPASSASCRARFRAARQNGSSPRATGRRSLPPTTWCAATSPSIPRPALRWRRRAPPPASKAT
jgi:isoquinoline 1-oxidoreductase beta subunit